MRAVIMQPYYLPYRGYFDLVAKADLFVVYDDVQYRHRFWQSRNRLLVDGKWWWMTIPVLTRGRRTQTINQVEIASGDWWRSHLGQIQRVYGDAPYFELVFPALERAFCASNERLVDLTVHLLEDMFSLAGLAMPKHVRSSSLGVPNRGRTEREVDICRILGATEYLSGPAATAYMRRELWAEASIRLGWHVPELPKYDSPTFDPYASIVDVVFWHGRDSHSFISGHIEWEG